MLGGKFADKSAQENKRKKLSRTAAQGLYWKKQLMPLFKAAPAQTEEKDTLHLDLQYQFERTGQREEELAFLEESVGDLSEQRRFWVWKRIGELKQGLGDNSGALSAYMTAIKVFGENSSPIAQELFLSPIQARIEELQISIKASKNPEGQSSEPHLSEVP